MIVIPGLLIDALIHPGKNQVEEAKKNEGNKAQGKRAVHSIGLHGIG